MDDALNVDKATLYRHTAKAPVLLYVAHLCGPQV